MRTLYSSLRLLMVSLVAVALPALAADDPLASYHDNALVCLDTVTHASCYIWIGNVWQPGDHHYLVQWDRGAQSELPTVGGNFRVEGREGEYTWKDGKLCLAPQANKQKQFKMEQQGELFAGPGCYELAPHAVGDKWTQKDASGREVTLWLLKGR